MQGSNSVAARGLAVDRKRGSSQLLCHTAAVPLQVRVLQQLPRMLLATSSLSCCAGLPLSLCCPGSPCCWQNGLNMPASTAVRQASAPGRLPHPLPLLRSLQVPPQLQGQWAVLSAQRSAALKTASSRAACRSRQTGLLTVMCCGQLLNPSQASGMSPGTWGECTGGSGYMPCTGQAAGSSDRAL